jgi:hypothetical protein
MGAMTLGKCSSLALECGDVPPAVLQMIPSKMAPFLRVRQDLPNKVNTYKGLRVALAACDDFQQFWTFTSTRRWGGDCFAVIGGGAPYLPSPGACDDGNIICDSKSN